MRPFVSIVLLLGVLVACGPRETRVIELEATAYGMHTVTKREGFAFGSAGGETISIDHQIIFRQWVNAGGFAQQGALVGFAAGNTSNYGNVGFFDFWTWKGYAAKVFFDLDPLPPRAILTKAELLMAPEQKVFSIESGVRPRPPVPGTPPASPLPEDRARFPDLCALLVSRADVPMIAIPSFDDELLPARPAFPRNLYVTPDDNPVDISRTVFDWWRGTEENLGLIISPKPERLFVRNTSRRCAAWLPAPTLRVTYTVPVMP